MSTLVIKMKFKINISKKAKYTLIVAILILVVTVVFAVDPSYYGHSRVEVVGACYSDGTNISGDSCTFLKNYDKISETDSNFAAIGYKEHGFRHAELTSNIAGNVLKYLSRAGHKDKKKVQEDLKKAEFYLKEAILMGEKNE